MDSGLWSRNLYIERGLSYLSHPLSHTNRIDQKDQTNQMCQLPATRRRKWEWQDLTLILLMSCGLAVPPGALAYLDAVV